MIAGINGQNLAKEITIDLSPLSRVPSSIELIVDGEGARDLHSSQLMPGDGTLTVQLQREDEIESLVIIRSAFLGIVVCRSRIHLLSGIGDWHGGRAMVFQGEALHHPLLSAIVSVTLPFGPSKNLLILLLLGPF